MRKFISLAFLLCALYSYSQEHANGHYTIGILPATSSSSGAHVYLDNTQAMISSAFASKSRFTVVDRTKFQQIASERNLQKQEDFINSNTIVEQGKNLGAQFLVSGSITQLSKSVGTIEKSKIVTSLTGKLASQKYNAYVTSVSITLNVQVIDVETGSVKSNRSISEITRTETTNEQVAVANAVAALEGNLKAWVNETFPVYMKIIKIESTNRKGLPETVLITGGEEMDLSKRKGMIFNVSSELEVYENEITVVDGKEYKREVKVGSIKVSEVQGELSVCKVKNGAEEIKKRLEAGKTLLLKITSY